MFHMTDMILELDDGAKTHDTSAGYLAAMPRVARTGIQLYRGSEVGRPGTDVVRIYRDEKEVFKKESLQTFTGKPFTDDHPPVPVDAKNWKDYSVGVVGEDILRDGECIRVPMVLMDAAAIAKVKGGKTQLSVGYTCDIDWTPGKTEDGQVFDGRQKDITVNHVAVVKHARGGSMLSIGDASKVSHAVMAGVKAIRAGEVNDLDPLVGGAGVTCLLDEDYPFLKDGKVYKRALTDARSKALGDGDTGGLLAIDMLLEIMNDGAARHNKEKMNMKTIIVDGISCEMSDTATQVVERALKALGDANKELVKKIGESEEDFQKRKKEMGDSIAELTTKLAAADAKVVTLEKQLSDSAITPAKLGELVKDRETVVTKAKALLPTVVVDGKTDDEIRSQVVSSVLGDAAKSWDGSQIKVSFDTLTAKVNANDSTQVNDGFNRTRSAFSQPPANQMADSEKRYDTYDSKLSNAWQNAGSTTTQ